MTSIFSIVIVFMATFVLVFGYMSFNDDQATPPTETPAAVSPESVR